MNDFRFTPATAIEAGFSTEGLRELETVLTTTVANGYLPGVVVLLARGDKVVLHKAIGQGALRDARPLRTDALYRLYSMTKPLTAVAMLILHEEGGWQFDDPISAHLPEFRDVARRPGSRATREPVVGELFVHGSGHSFGDTIEEVMATAAELDLFGSASLDELVGKVASQPLRYEPGSRWDYNLAMDLQAAIVERISGQCYDRFVEARIFGPLGMKDSGFALGASQAARLVPGYAMDIGTRALRIASDAEMQETIFPMGGTSFRSTAGDYARFVRMLLNRGRLGDVRLLTPETAELMFTNRLSEAFLKDRYNALHYVVGGGNGFSLNGLLCIDPEAAGRPVGRNSYEWAGAFGSWFWADPEHDIVFVGMTNRLMPHAEIAPLSVMTQDIVYRALQR